MSCRRAEGCEVGAVRPHRLADERLDTRRTGDGEAAGLHFTVVGERVGHAGRDEGEVAGLERRALVAEGELEGAVQDEERLGRLAVQMERWTGVADGEDGLVTASCPSQCSHRP